MGSRRDEVWELKRQRFLSNQGNGQQSPNGSGRSGRPAPPAINTSGGGYFEGASSPSRIAPTSPLSRLMQGGYPTPTGGPTPQGFQAQSYSGQPAALPPRAPPGPGLDTMFCFRLGLELFKDSCVGLTPRVAMEFFW